MTSIRTFIVCMGSTLVVGCPGTLQDPAAYDGYDRAPYAPDEEADDEADEVDAGPSRAAQADGGGAWDAASGFRAEASAPAPSWEDAAPRPDWMEPGAGWGDAAARADASQSGGGDAGSSAEAGASCDFRALMQARCGNASCHGGATASTGLDLTTAGLAERVRGQRGSGACGQYLLVDPERPAESALYLKVTDDACGVRMPVGASLSDSEQACILQWIERL